MQNVKNVKNVIRNTIRKEPHRPVMGSINIAINIANLKKTLYYLKRNGFRNTWYAARERLEEGRRPAYHFEEVSEKELAAQRRWSKKRDLTFSIVVPAYRTGEAYLRAMLDSVRNQSYPHWELLLADATEDDSVQKAAESCQDDRIHYFRLAENQGISGNTNQALQRAGGDYVGLLDHDDMLTPDALYEMAVRIEKGKEDGISIKMLYSDEDKCNGGGTRFYEPNKKEGFNLDLLLSNNYICHFLVMEQKLIKELGLRPEYDGAQDYDLALRASERLMKKEEEIAHIPRVLYHWRCHSASTAENPRSKEYAYEAGRRAVQDFADRQKYQADAVPLKHMGFYALLYRSLPIKCRKDLGAVGGRIIIKGRTAGGRMTNEGILLYEGLPAPYSGYLHRAVLTQDADAVDIRCIQVREECWDLFRRITHVPYVKIPGDVYFDASTLPEGTDYREMGVALCKALKEAGWRILYMPSLTVEWDERRRRYRGAGGR